MNSGYAWQDGLQQLCTQGTLAGYALLTNNGRCELAEGLLAGCFGMPGSNDVSLTAQQFFHVFDSGKQTQAFNLLDQRAVVFKQTPCDVYAISRRKQLGLCVNNLPFGVLVSVFQKPHLPQTVIPRLEKLCSSFRL